MNALHYRKRPPYRRHPMRKVLSVTRCEVSGGLAVFVHELDVCGHRVLRRNRRTRWLRCEDCP